MDRIASKKENFIAKINVSIKNKMRLIRKLIIVIIGKSNSNIRNLRITDRTNDFFKLMKFDVTNKEHLNNILGSLRTSEFIETVIRI